MSFAIATPEMMTAAAGDLAGIGSALGDATAAAAAPTTAVTAAAADDVSLWLSQLFAAYGKQFQAVAVQAGRIQGEFVRLMQSGAAAYANAETSANSLLGSASNSLSSALGWVSPPIYDPSQALVDELGNASDWFSIIEGSAKSAVSTVSSQATSLLGSATDSLSSALGGVAPIIHDASQGLADELGNASDWFSII